MIKDLKKAKDRVEHLLSKYPSTRDCDKLLWIGYLVIFHDLRKELGERAYLKFIEILIGKDCCSMESVRRVRQKLQEQGKYLGTKRQEKLDEADEVKEFIRDGGLDE